MKYTPFFIVLFLFYFITNSFAQGDGSNTYQSITDEDGKAYGMVLMAGVGLASADLTDAGQSSYSNISAGAGISLSGGFFSTFRMIKKLSFQPEFLIHGITFNNFTLNKILTEKSSVEDSNGINGFTKYRFSIPLLFKINLLNKTYFYIGPKIDYNFSIKDKRYFIRDADLANFGFGGVIGLEYKYNDIIKFNVRYTHTISKVLNTKSEDAGTKYNFSDHYVEAGLHLNFFRTTNKFLSGKAIRQEIETIKTAQNKLDKDNDGILDVDDKCPTVPGTMYSQGCPPDKDSDKDGVLDSKDKCPKVPGNPSNSGCPAIDKDSDNDGVLDSRDKCPKIPGLPSNQGCPLSGDSDNDGVLDTQDQCPNIPGEPSNGGCPLSGDRDKDGVIDTKDPCPDIFGPASNKGCPLESAEAVFKAALKGIQFETGKSILKNISYVVLNKVVVVLKANPKYKLLKISGHTDNVGNPTKNLILSKERAISVRDYLVAQGIPVATMRAEGFGSSKPLLPNTNTANKEQNRRVEFEWIR